jgi:hypothetical protein
MIGEWWHMHWQYTRCTKKHGTSKFDKPLEDESRLGVRDE